MVFDKIYIDETASTNAELKGMFAASQAKEGTVLCTAFQTAGRGQKGSVWESEKSKNLLFSFVLCPDFIRANEQFVISQLVSLSVKETLDKYIGDVSIKWSNDIYWRDRKICGILIENELLNDNILFSITGVGLNVNQEYFSGDAPNPVSLKRITGTTCNADAILDEILERLAANYRLAQTNKSSISEKYRQNLYRKDGYHRFADNGGEFDARIVGVTGSGLLELQTSDGNKQQYAFKQVRFV
jgi:BirA family biotin operon repressor/biotin-[acetyl-CoA-carboxylase] ligase